MQNEITARYHAGILHEAMQRYAIDPGHITPLDAFESYIYAFHRATGNGDVSRYILRIGHSLRRSPALIQAEVDWINFLAAGGAGVARAVMSAAGRLVEAIDDDQGGQFLATAFEHAPGRRTGEIGWSPALYEAYGRLLGRIHALSQRYDPPPDAPRRLHWDHPTNNEVFDWLPPEEDAARRHFADVLDHLGGLPRTAQAYGLIHQDAHPGNFLVTDDGRITLFDFDDCVYGHYIYDVAMVVFYMAVNEDDPEGLLRAFWPRFWAGYRAEFALDAAWLAELPWFFKLREIDLYAVLHRSADFLAASGDEWAKTFLRGRKARIDAGLPLFNFDFTP